jgi:DNA-binding HxlR family transcriptional regulator
MATRLRPGSRLPARAETACPATCPTRQTLARLADRWTVELIESLASRAQRFGELRAAISGISEKMLTQTLRSLERDGFVHRRELPGIPPGAEYRLTDLGRSLLEPLTAVRAWSRRHMDDVEQARSAYDQR